MKRFALGFLVGAAFAVAVRAASEAGRAARLEGGFDHGYDGLPPVMFGRSWDSQWGTGGSLCA